VNELIDIHTGLPSHEHQYYILSLLNLYTIQDNKAISYRIYQSKQTIETRYGLDVSITPPLYTNHGQISSQMKSFHLIQINPLVVCIIPRDLGWLEYLGNISIPFYQIPRNTLLLIIRNIFWAF